MYSLPAAAAFRLPVNYKQLTVRERWCLAAAELSHQTQPPPAQLYYSAMLASRNSVRSLRALTAPLARNYTNVSILLSFYSY